MAVYSQDRDDVALEDASSSQQHEENSIIGLIVQELFSLEALAEKSYHQDVKNFAAHYEGASGNS